MSISSTSQGPCGSTSRVHFYDEDRYATDCGPQCSRKCAADGKSFWVYIVAHPFREVLAQCASCHELLTFDFARPGEGSGERPTITQVKASHRRYLAKRCARSEPPAAVDRIDFDSDELEVAMQWHGGQSSMLYAIASTGSLSRGTVRIRKDCDTCGGFQFECAKCYGRGQPMTDVQWLAHLAAELSGEADSAADDARDQGLAEDAARLDAVAAKCNEAIAKLGEVS